MTDKIMEVKNIHKQFKISRKQQKIMGTDSTVIVAVDDLSFELLHREIFCLLGTNGAGKTTTLRMLAGLIKAQKGQIKIYGELFENAEDVIKKKIGFLTSELKLDGSFTPNYLFNYFGQLYHLDSATIRQRKEKLFKKFGIDKFAEIKIKNLSTGMKQKVSIAISLVHNPDIVIFDEPTNGLDIVTSREIVEFLKELKKEGKSIIISTHIFEIVDKLADRIGIMVDGKMVCYDSYREITKEQNIEEVFFEQYYRWEGTNE